MKISTKVQYATRALLDIALNQNKKPVQLKGIAERQQISLSYLEHIINPLIAAGLIKSLRGPRGGVSLARPPQQIRLTDIVEAIDGPISLVKCLSNAENCSRSGVCVTQDIWGELQKAMDDVLVSTTLKDMVKRQKEKAKTPATMYYI